MPRAAAVVTHPHPQTATRLDRVVRVIADDARRPLTVTYDEDNYTLSLSFNSSVLATLPLATGRTALTAVQEVANLSDAALSNTCFTEWELDWNPIGHEPSAGIHSGLGYGVPHFDCHLFWRPWTLQSRQKIKFGAGGNQSEFLAPVNASLLPSPSALVLDPSSAVPAQGIHYVPIQDWDQVYKAMAKTGDLGFWSGISFMAGSFGGNLTFIEIMVSEDRLIELRADHQTNARLDFPVPPLQGGDDALEGLCGDCPFQWPSSFYVAYVRSRPANVLPARC